MELKHKQEDYFMLMGGLLIVPYGIETDLSYAWRSPMGVF